MKKLKKKPIRRKNMTDREHYERLADSMTEKPITTREKWRELRGLNHRLFDNYLARVYAHGFGDGVKAAEDALGEKAAQADDTAGEIVQIDWEEIKETLRKVKGVGEKTLEKMQKAIEENFG